MKKYYEREQTILECRDELLKQLHPMIHINGYPSEAVPKATILELPALLRVKIKSSHPESMPSDKDLLSFAAEIGKMQMNLQTDSEPITDLLKFMRGWLQSHPKRDLREERKRDFIKFFDYADPIYWGENEFKSYRKLIDHYLDNN